MSLLILEGLDRTGKSTVAEYYRTKGYEVIHQSAPAKGMTADLFLEESMQLITSASAKDIVLDRSYYGELIWPTVFGREPLLTEDAIEILQEIEESVGIERILMHDPNVEAHWKRCVDNHEPLTKAQFVKARTLYSAMAEKYKFIKKTIRDYPESQTLVSVESSKHVEVIQTPQVKTSDSILKLTKEQLKLETANAINDVLAKRIVKQKGQVFDQIENNLRSFLNAELGKILGTKTETSGQFSNEEVELLRFFCKKLKEKQ